MAYLYTSNNTVHLAYSRPLRPPRYPKTFYVARTASFWLSSAWADVLIVSPLQHPQSWTLRFVMAMRTLLKLAATVKVPTNTSKALKPWPPYPMLAACADLLPMV